jgi:hypothetical protein
MQDIPNEPIVFDFSRLTLVINKMAFCGVMFECMLLLSLHHSNLLPENAPKKERIADDISFP